MVNELPLSVIQGSVNFDAIMATLIHNDQRPGFDEYFDQQNKKHMSEAVQYRLQMLAFCYVSSSVWCI